MLARPCCSAFGKDADLALMRQIATPGRPNHDANEFAMHTLETLEAPGLRQGGDLI
jgi:hypothetical protein